MTVALDAIISAHVAAATAHLHKRVTDLHNALTELAAQHGDLKDRHERMLRPGTVDSVDGPTQTYRHVIGLDEDGNQVLSPSVHYAQHAGALSHHVMPSKGQQMLLVSPDGDIEQAIGIPFGWSNQNKSPSNDPNTMVGSFGGISWSFNGGVLTVTGGVTIKGDFKASGGVFTHNSKDVGSTHKHDGVQAGGDDTGVPV